MARIDHTDAVIAAARKRGGELLPLLRGVVEINSFSANVAGVNAAGERLAAALDLPGLTLQRRAGGEGIGDHLAWTTPAWAGAASRIILVGHHDTVFPPGSFEVWEQEGDRLRGPGVLDMKGGLMVCRTALAALADAGLLADLPLCMVSVADEEIGSIDSRPWLEELGRGAAAALVFEAGRADDSVVTARKGTGRFRVHAHGRAAHAGNDPGAGRSAIRALARFVDAVEGLADPARGLTVNVGLFRGGSSANTVPAEAECEVDFRYVRARDGVDLVAAVDRLARDIGAAAEVRFAITGGIRRAPLERSEASAALYRRYAACAVTAGLGGGECPLVGGGSDANTLSAVGVPAIDALGPRGRGFHTHDEHLVVSTLAQRVDALVRFLCAS